MTATRMLAALVCGLALAAQAATAQTLTTLYQFTNQADGSGPQSALVYQNGSLYGVTGNGGATGNGTVFKIDPATGAYTLLYSFQGGADGAVPSVLVGNAGTLYGETQFGGSSTCAGGCGTVYSLNASTGVETVLYAFAATEADPANPFPQGLLYHAGILYGTAVQSGGTGCLGSGCGKVFRLDPASGAETMLHIFTGGADGGAPVASPTYYAGALYTTTYLGGGSGCGGLGCGTLAKVAPDTGSEKIAYAFTGGLSGSTPYSILVPDNGILYTTTLGGVDDSLGGIVAFNPTTGAERVLHSFNGLADGALPFGGLVQAGGALYGLTYQAGAYPAQCRRASAAPGCGTIFKVKEHSGATTVEHRFMGTDGAHAFAGLIYAGGAFYGTTSAGGSTACKGGCGTVFKFVP